jgi:PAS domain S-box-containing protein
MDAPDEKRARVRGSEPNGAVANEPFIDPATIRAVLQGALIGLWSWDADANTVSLSSHLESLHDISGGAFAGQLASFLVLLHPDDRGEVEAGLHDALRSQVPYRARYRIAPAPRRDETWIEAIGTVVTTDGAPRGVAGLCYDITDRISLESELRNRARQQEALAQLGERALAEPDLDRLLNDAVSTVAMTLSVDFVKILELLPGDGQLALRAGFGWKSSVVGTVVTTTEPNTLVRFTMNASVPVVIDDFGAETRFEVPGYLKDNACTSGMTVTIAGRDGRAFGILGVCTSKKRRFSAQDLSFLAAVGNLLAGAIQRRQLEHRHELMIRDMRHRSGNLFSQLLALFSQTARTSKGIPDLSSKYQARVLAMANAHRLITEGGWKSIPIMDLLYVLLGPYLDRVAFNGPNIDLEPDPVFNLSAALHELATNAVKHGSLSRSKGQLDLRWSVSRMDRGMTLAMEWIEKNGPPVRQPRRTGFGTRLIDLVIQRQLNGEVTRTYSLKGMAVKMLLPLTRERWPTAFVAERPQPSENDSVRRL